jgi:2-keto-4-pentenoate hydratase/2-oxohepta-3-ene-1,7-dioic acid hydratase in catechol pathway
MKLVSFKVEEKQRLGVINDEMQIIDIALALGAEENIPASMLEFIILKEKGKELARRALLAGKKEAVFSPEEIVYLPPVTDPGKICGVALNNSASNDRKIAAPDHPAFFLKPSSCLVGHRQTVRIRSYYGSVHPEPELAVIIGKKVKDVDAVDVHGFIYGYSIFNDITGNGMRAEDLFHYQALYAAADDPDRIEKREQHLSYAGRYKGTDNFGVLGPWLVTGDEVADPDDLQVSCRVAGEPVAEDSTRYYNYRVAELVSFISQFQTLFPGDIVSCGTAFAPGNNRKSIHHANLLVTGGPMEITIESLGSQYNDVEIEEKEMGAWRLD